MPVTIPSGLTDDNDFVALLNRLLGNLVAHVSPQELWVIQIDNWFDHKWLRFSGYGAVAPRVPLGNNILSVKREFWQDKLTFPPFSPDRVLGQWSFKRAGEDYVEFPTPRLPHKTQRQYSFENLHRRVEDFVCSALFVWFSGNSLKNGRASIMVYDIVAEMPACWFAAFSRKKEWKLGRAKGIDANEVASLLTLE